MGRTWMTNLQDFLDEKGNLPQGLPVPARRLARSIGEFIAFATNFDGEDDEVPPRCFAIIKRKRCQGRVMPLLSMEDDYIRWYCPTCGDSGFISGWQGTLWDLSEHGELN